MFEYSRSFSDNFNLIILVGIQHLHENGRISCVSNRLYTLPKITLLHSLFYKIISFTTELWHLNEIKGISIHLTGKSFFFFKVFATDTQEKIILTLQIYNIPDVY